MWIVFLSRSSFYLKEKSDMCCLSLFFFFPFFIIFAIVDLQCCVSGVQQSESVIHQHISSLFLRFFSYIALQSIEYSSLCCF